MTEKRAREIIAKSKSAHHLQVMDARHFKRGLTKADYAAVLPAMRRKLASLYEAQIPRVRTRRTIAVWERRVKAWQFSPAQKKRLLTLLDARDQALRATKRGR